MKKLNLAIKNGAQLNAQEILNGRFYHDKKGWTKLDLKEDKNLALEMIIKVIGGRKKDIIKSRLKWSNPQHWGLERIVFVNYHGKIRAQYYAGQDHPYELNQLRKYLYSI